MHGVLNYVSFLTEQLPYGLKSQRFVEQLNAALLPLTGSDLRVYARHSFSKKKKVNSIVAKCRKC